jgi:hypothetical protein
MGSENSKNNNNRLSPTSNSYPFSINSNNELDYQKHSPESQKNHLEDLNENHEYPLPLDFQRDDSNDQTNNEEENTGYEKSTKIGNFNGKGEFQTIADEELQRVADDEFWNNLTTDSSQEEDFYYPSKKIYLKEHFFEATSAEELEKLKKEPWHKFYYKVPPKKENKAPKRFGFENRTNALTTQKTIYVHHFPNNLNPQRFIHPIIISQFDNSIDTLSNV